MNDKNRLEKELSDYEERELIAIESGKKAFQGAEWLFNRVSTISKGFFFELHENDAVHPNHYSVHCVDGVGTKLFLSAWSNNYALQPIDGVAMNANDMATGIHAWPDAVDLYFAVQEDIELYHMGDIMSGFVDIVSVGPGPEETIIR